jgi:hypothetical protein
MHFIGFQLTIEQFQAGTHDLLYGLYDRRQNLIGHDLVRLTGQTVFQRTAPGDPQFGIDVDDVDSGGYRTQEIFVIHSRPAVEGEKDSNCFLDLGNPLDVQVLLGFPFDHAFHHAMHVANRRGKVIDCSGVDELSSLLRCGEIPEFAANAFVDFRAGSDVAYLSFREDCGIDRFDGFPTASFVRETF